MIDWFDAAIAAAGSVDVADAETGLAIRSSAPLAFAANDATPLEGPFRGGRPTARSSTRSLLAHAQPLVSARLRCEPRARPFIDSWSITRVKCCCLPCNAPTPTSCPLVCPYFDCPSHGQATASHVVSFGAFPPEDGQAVQRRRCDCCAVAFGRSAGVHRRGSTRSSASISGLLGSATSSARPYASENSRRISRASRVANAMSVSPGDRTGIRSSQAQ